MAALFHFSHILAFACLTVAAIFDVKSDKGDVPDVFPLIALVGGVVLHGAEAYLSGSWNPLIFSLGAGTVFSIYGWAAYWKGMWGGADALALSTLGFAAPYLTPNFSGVLTQGFNLFINLLLATTVYTLVFAVFRAWKTEGFMGELRKKLVEDRMRIGMESGVAASVFLVLPLKTAAYFYLGILALILMFRFLKVVENYALTEKVDVEKLEGGEVLKETKIRGVTEEEIDEMEGEVEVVHGLRLLPVFPIALILTDAGVSFIVYFAGVF